jgi:hypothetical protein
MKTVKARLSLKQKRDEDGQGRKRSTKDGLNI